jgi:hypothetical protein
MPYPPTVFELTFLLILFGWPIASLAAMLLSLQHVSDGSTDPPGDRISLRFPFLPDDGNLTVEVRGFARQESRPNGIVDLPSRGPRTGPFRELEVIVVQQR